MPDAEGLVRIYQGASERIRKALLALDPETYTSAAAAATRKETRAAVRDLNRACVAWGDEAVDAAWALGAGKARTTLEILGRKPVLPAAKNPQQPLKDALGETLLKANGTIAGVVNGFLGLTAMAAKVLKTAELQEFNFGEAGDELKGLAEEAVRNEKSRKALAGQVRASLAQQIQAGNIIEINGKRWRADRYADNVARTTLRQAQTDATLELCRVYENDLVQWSDHGTQCGACSTYEGQIYSISGRHPVYPMLTESPPLHPNCEHSLLPTTDEAIAVQKMNLAGGGYLEGATWAAPRAPGPAWTRKAKPAPKAGPKKYQPKIRENLAEWQEAKSMDEAVAWAKKELCTGEVDYSRCSLKMANLINKEMDEVRKFGYKFDWIKPDEGHFIAYIQRTELRGGKIGFAYNPKYMADTAKLRNAAWMNSLSLCKGDTAEAIIWHERGHFLDDFWCRANRIKWGSSATRSNELWKTWTSQFKSKAARVAWEKRIEKEVSGTYMWCKRESGLKNVNEFFAEAYRLYKQNRLPDMMASLGEKFKEWGW